MDHHRKKHKLLILQHKQFGYHTDSYMYSKYIDTQKFSISYMCFDAGLPRIDLEHVNIIYIPYAGGRVRSYARFIFRSTARIRKEKFDTVFYIKGKFALVLRLLNLNHRFILDIRTGDLSGNERKRRRRNTALRMISSLFRKISIISDSLREHMKLKPGKTNIIPLGAERQELEDKDFFELNLLYIGSLNKRNIDQTIRGLALYLKQYKPDFSVRYDIVGFGKKDTIRDLEQTIEENSLSDRVVYHGRRKVDELLPFLENANCGIVYVPQTAYYEFQPSTKLFEFLLAGIPVIATDTYENRRNLKKGCGVLTEDNPEAFAEALNKFMEHSPSFHSTALKQQYGESEWRIIVRKYFEPLFETAGRPT